MAAALPLRFEEVRQVRPEVARRDTGHAGEFGQARGWHAPLPPTQDSRVRNAHLLGNPHRHPAPFKEL
jgi:hypothetical protein